MGLTSNVEIRSPVTEGSVLPTGAGAAPPLHEPQISVAVGTERGPEVPATDSGRHIAADLGEEPVARDEEEMKPTSLAVQLAPEPVHEPQGLEPCR